MDRFANTAITRHSPGMRHWIVTPADGTPQNPRPRAIRAQTAGTLAVRDESGVVILYTLVAGELLPFSPWGVDATGTTATVVGWD